MSIFISNGERTCEVVLFEPARDRMALLHWENEDYGVMYEKRISEANAEGYRPVEAPQ